MQLLVDEVFDVDKRACGGHDLAVSMVAQGGIQHDHIAVTVGEERVGGFPGRVEDFPHQGVKHCFRKLHVVGAQRIGGGYQLGFYRSHQFGGPGPLEVKVVVGVRGLIEGKPGMVPVRGKVRHGLLHVLLQLVGEYLGGLLAEIIHKFYPVRVGASEFIQPGSNDVDFIVAEVAAGKLREQRPAKHLHNPKHAACPFEGDTAPRGKVACRRFLGSDMQQEGGVFRRSALQNLLYGAHNSQLSRSIPTTQPPQRKPVDC